MTDVELRDAVRSLIGDAPTKIWLIRRSAHRLEFIWALGPSQLKDPVEVAAQKRFHLVAQNLPDTLGAPLAQLLRDYVAGDHAAEQMAGERFLRAVQIPRKKAAARG